MAVGLVTAMGSTFLPSYVAGPEPMLMDPGIQGSASYPLSVEIKKRIKFLSTSRLGPQGVVPKQRAPFPLPLY
jgi:hypothetical protein